VLKSTRLDSRTEDVRIVAIVIAKFELVNVERKILVTHFMERADDATLYQRPKAFNGLRMYVAMHVLTDPVIHHAVREMFIEVAITPMLVGRDKADTMRDSLMHKGVKRLRIDFINNTADDVSFALNGSDHNGFPMTAGAAGVARSTWAAALVFVPIASLPADIGFVDFDVANQLLEFDIAERKTNLVAHEQRGIVGTEAHDAVDLQSAYALLTRQHHMHDAEPLAQRFVGVLEDRSDEHREAVADAFRRALVAVPVVGLLTVFMDIIVAAARAAYRAVGPAVRGQVRLAGVFVREQLLELSNRHLVNLQVLGFLVHMALSHSGAIRP
jgi:hypothetical protein